MEEDGGAARRRRLPETPGEPEEGAAEGERGREVEKPQCPPQERDERDAEQEERVEEDLPRRLTVAACLTFGTFSTIISYQYWRIGTAIAVERDACLQARP